MGLCRIRFEGDTNPRVTARFDHWGYFLDRLGEITDKYYKLKKNYAGKSKNVRTVS